MSAGALLAVGLDPCALRVRAAAAPMHRRPRSLLHQPLLPPRPLRGGPPAPYLSRTSPASPASYLGSPRTKLTKQGPYINFLSSFRSALLSAMQAVRLCAFYLCVLLSAMLARLLPACAFT
eukprot:5704613-Pleurochrysis_carterae.AAC.3